MCVTLPFILYMALGRLIGAELVIHLSGYEKADISIPCRYGRGYESYEKYLCRHKCGAGDVLIKSNEKKRNKYSAYDDRTEKVFTVSISDLSPADAGLYRCGVQRFFGDDYPARVQLTVVPDSCCEHQSTMFQSHEGGSVSISCMYDSKYGNNLKYICRGAQPSKCLRQALIMSNSSRDTGRFKLTDNQESSTFTVTVTGLTLKDSGLYLCGIHTNANMDNFSAVELKVEVLETTTVTSIITVETVRPQTDPSNPNTDPFYLSHLFLFSIGAAVLIPISAVIIVYQCKYRRGQVELAGDGVNRSRNKADAHEVMHLGNVRNQTSEASQHHEVSDSRLYRKQETSKQPSSSQRRDVTSRDQQDPVYQNVDAIYCNQFYNGV